MQQKQRFASSNANQVEIGAIGRDRQMLHGGSSRGRDWGVKEAADFPLSRLVWPAILAY
jgi:hypothetical protein